MDYDAKLPDKTTVVLHEKLEKQAAKLNNNVCIETFRGDDRNLEISQIQPTANWLKYRCVMMFTYFSTT